MGRAPLTRLLDRDSLLAPEQSHQSVTTDIIATLLLPWETDDIRIVKLSTRGLVLMSEPVPHDPADREVVLIATLPGTACPLRLTGTITCELTRAGMQGVSMRFDRLSNRATREVRRFVAAALARAA